jgi:hypothetical protein
MQVKYGSYTGDGTSSKAITGVGFNPDLIIVKSNDGSDSIFRTSVMPANTSIHTRADLATLTTAILSNDTDGFTLGNDSNVNTNLTSYIYICVRDDGAGDFKVGSYTGNGIDNRTLTGIGFKPDLFVTKGNINGTGTYKMASYPNKSAAGQVFFGAGGQTWIHSTDSDGMTFSGENYANQSGTTYYWFAFKRVTGKTFTGYYAGDSSASKSFTDPGFKPGWVWVKDDNNQSPNFKTISHSSTNSQPFDGAYVTNGITSLDANGFTISNGAQVNIASGNFYYFCLYDPTSAQQTRGVSTGMLTTLAYPPTTMPTTYINDPMTTVAPTGTLTGNATWINNGAGLSYLRLTEALNNQSGNVEYATTIPQIMETHFDFYMSAAGADAVYFYWGCNTSPNNEDNDFGGYIVALDEYNGDNAPVQLQFRGVRIANTTGAAAFANAAWHTCKITIFGTLITVFVDGVQQISFTDTARTLLGSKIGFGSRTGGANDEHRVRNLIVSSPIYNLSITTNLIGNKVNTTAVNATLQNAGPVNANSTNSVFSILERAVNNTLALLSTLSPNPQIPRGVSISGMEFGSAFPGTIATDYFLSAASTYNYFGAKGFNIVRLAFMWERMQPSLNSAIYAGYKGEIDAEITKAANAGMKVILDMHNFGRRNIINTGGFNATFGTTTDVMFQGGTISSGTPGKISSSAYNRIYAGNYTQAGPYKIQADMRVDSNAGQTWNNIQLEAMRADVNNRYFVTLNTNTGAGWELYKVVGGVQTQIATGVVAYTTGTYYTIILDCGNTTANTLVLTIGGTQVYSGATDGALTGGQVAFYGNGASLSVTNVTLTVGADTSSGRTGSGFYRVGDAQLPITAFADFWSRMATAYSGNSNVMAFDLMNEPHDMPVPTTTSNYLTTATVTLMMQAGINAIRLVDKTKWIIAELDAWAGIQTFVSEYGSNPTPWLSDGADRLVYSFHYYCDDDHSGSYALAFKTSNNTAISGDVTPFISWCQTNSIPVFCGEYGVPNTSAWQVCLTTLFGLFNTYKVWSTQWSAGDAYTSITTLQPSAGPVDVLQMAIVGLAANLGNLIYEGLGNIGMFTLLETYAGYVQLFQDAFNGDLSNYSVGNGTWGIIGGTLNPLTQANPNWNGSEIQTIKNTYTDFDLSVRVKKGTANNQVIFRTDNGVGHITGYGIQLRSGYSGRAVRLESWASALLVEVDSGITWATGTWYRVRIRVVGWRIQSKVWLDGNAEPGTWLIDYTDNANLYASGAIGFSNENNLDSAFDDLVVTSIPNYTAAILTILETSFIKKTVALFTDFLTSVTTGNKTNAVLTTLEKVTNATTAIYTNLESSLKNSTTALFSLLEKPAKATAALLTNFEKKLSSTIAFLTTFARTGNSTTPVLTNLEANIKSTFAVNATLQNSQVYSSTAALSILEANKRNTTAILTTLEKQVQNSTTALITSLSKPGSNNTALLTILEEYSKPNTVAMLTTLETKKNATTSLLTILESNTKGSTIALAVILESYTNKSTISLITALESYSKASTLGVNAILESATKLSVSGMLTLLETSMKTSTFGVFTTMEKVLGVTIPLLTTFERTKGVTIPVTTTLEQVQKNTLAALTNLEVSKPSTIPVLTIFNRAGFQTLSVLTLLGLADPLGQHVVVLRPKEFATWLNIRNTETILRIRK